MTKESKSESKIRQFVFALAFLIPLIGIVVAEAAGWNVMSVYLAVDAIEYLIVIMLIVLALVLLLPLLWPHIRTRFF